MSSRQSARIKSKKSASKFPRILDDTDEDEDTTVSHATLRAQELSEDPIESVGDTDSDTELEVLSSTKKNEKMASIQEEKKSDDSPEKNEEKKSDDVAEKDTEKASTPAQDSHSKPKRGTTGSHKKSRFGKRNLAADFSGSTKKKKQKKEKVADKWMIVRVKPDGEEGHGFCIMSDSYSDYAMSQPFFNRNSKKNQRFLLAIQPVMYCMKGKCASGSGFRMRTPRPTDEKEYPLRNIAILCDPDTSREDIESYMKETFIPALTDLGVKDCPEIYEHETVTSWFNILDKDDTIRVLNTVVSVVDKKKWKEMGIQKVTRQRFLKKDRDYVYAFFPEGQLPEDFIEDNKLKAIHLKAGDQDKAVPDDEASESEAESEEEDSSDDDE